jgi:hypothetical protein
LSVGTDYLNQPTQDVFGGPEHREYAVSGGGGHAAWRRCLKGNLSVASPQGNDGQGGPRAMIADGSSVALDAILRSVETGT